MSKPAQIKIISDGTGFGTQVLDMEGRPIRGISSLSIEVEATGPVRAMLVFNDVLLEMKALAELPPDERIDGTV